MTTARVTYVRRCALAHTLVALLLGCSTACEPPPTTPPPTTVPAAGPTMLYGDSLAQQAANYLRFFYAQDKGRPLTVRAMGGTAPCDWVGIIEADLKATPKPRAVMLEFYGNSFTPCMGGQSAPTVIEGHPIGGDEFLAVYRDSFDRILRAATAAKIQVTWVVPPVRPGTDPAPGLNETLADMARRRGWKVVDGSASVATSTGAWTRTKACATWETAEDGCEAGQIPVRDDSRVHFWFTDDTGYSPGAMRWASASVPGMP